MKIVFYLMTHKNELQIQRLLAHLKSFGNSFVLIHHDAKSTPLSLTPDSGLHILENPTNVVWGQISLVNAMYRGIDWLISEKFNFDWLIYLSGQDYPIKPHQYITSELERSTSDAYVHHEIIWEDEKFHTRYFHTLC
jgi:hypothetical protein